MKKITRIFALALAFVMAFARNKKYYYKIVPSKGVNATIGVIRFSKKK